jgi:glutaredoxin
MQQKSIVYSQPNCQACSAVKVLLGIHGFDVEERVIDGHKWKKSDLLGAAPNARSVPQVIINGQLVGGLIDVSNFLRPR